MKNKILDVLIILSVFLIFTSVQAASLKIGSRNSDVTTLQQALISKGYLKTTATGYFGSLTKSAVIAFQTANGLKSDGVVGVKTLALLNNIQGNQNNVVSTPTTNLNTTTGIIFQVSWLMPWPRDSMSILAGRRSTALSRSQFIGLKGS